jgi:hypothetical protein
MQKLRKKPQPRSNDYGLALGCAVIGAAFMLAVCGDIAFRNFVKAELRNEAEFARIMAERSKPKEVEVVVPVSKPVPLYKPGEKLSKSALAVAKANDVAMLTAFVPGEVEQ